MFKFNNKDIKSIEVFSDRSQILRLILNKFKRIRKPWVTQTIGKRR